MKHLQNIRTGILTPTLCNPPSCCLGSIRNQADCLTIPAVFGRDALNGRLPVVAGPPSFLRPIARTSPSTLTPLRRRSGLEPAMDLVRRLYSTEPPPATTNVEDNPTLLVSWWCTGFSLAIILVRLSGRYIRTERLFREDKIMALSIIPLMLRMGLVHVILLWGTNNAITTGLTEVDIHHREIGSRLVLASRIMYAAFLWVAKFTISEFLKRSIGQFWRRSYEVGLQFIRYFLVITFCGVVIATLVECQPFTHYWQVVPDPGPKCRQGYAQLITMGTCDVITDLLLVGFPIPVVIVSSMAMKRKISLVLLFGLSLILVAITTYRVPAIIERRGSQQFRSLLASFEILAAAAVSNALVLGSFVRDRGIKIQRFKFGSTTDTIERGSTRRGTITHHHWGSDADLAGDVGMRLDPELREKTYVARPAPATVPANGQIRRNPLGVMNSDWHFPSSGSTTISDEKIDNGGAHSPGEVSMMTSRRMSFFDVGGLLETGYAGRTLHANTLTASSGSTSSPPLSRHSATHQLVGTGSKALLQDMGGMLSSHEEVLHPPSSPTRNFSRPTSSQLQTPEHPPTIGATVGPSTTSTRPPRVFGLPRQHTAQSLQDVGGLLGPR